MAVIEARYLNGSSIQLTKCESVGHIMIRVANLHKRFAQEIAVTCPDTGRNLTYPVSQIPPPVVQIVIKPEEKITDENLLSALRLHGRYEDAATCARAYEMLQKEHSEDEIYKVLLGVLDKPENDGTDTEIQKNIVQTLLRVGVNLNFFLKEASENGNESRVKMLLSAGIPVECNEVEDEEPWSERNFAPPLSAAARNGEVGVVKVLLAHKADVNRKAILSDKDFGTPLLFACDYSRADVVRELITHKAAVNLPAFGKRPLPKACAGGSAPVVELLLTNRANPIDEHDRLGHLEGCLFEACHSGSAEVVKMLLNHGAKLPEDHFGTLLSYTTSADVAKILMAEFLTTPLFAACRYSALDMINYLFDCMADVNATVRGQTPLHVYANPGFFNNGVVSILLARKADVNKEDSDGKTALAYAVDMNWKPLADILLEHSVICSTSPSADSSDVYAENIRCGHRIPFVLPSSHRSTQAGERVVHVRTSSEGSAAEHAPDHVDGPNLTEKSFADQSEGESRNRSSASANKRSMTDTNEEGSGYCSATSANKRHKKNEDETSWKKHFVRGNDVVQEKGKDANSTPAVTRTKRMRKTKVTAKK